MNACGASRMLSAPLHSVRRRFGSGYPHPPSYSCAPPFVELLASAIHSNWNGFRRRYPHAIAAFDAQRFDPDRVRLSTCANGRISDFLQRSRRVRVAPFAGNRTDVARSDLLDEIAIRCRRGQRLAELDPNFVAREQTRISSRQPLFIHIEHALARPRRFYRRSEPLISGTVLHQQHTTRTNHSRATVLIPRC